MKMKMKIVITNISAEDAASLVTLLPDGCRFTMSSEEVELRRRSGVRVQGVQPHLLRHMAQQGGSVRRKDLAEVAKEFGARNPSSSIFSLIRAGKVAEQENGRLKMTDKGREAINQKEN